MPTKNTAQMASLLGLVTSDSDLDHIMPSPDSNQENALTTKAKKPAQTAAAKPKGRPPGKTTTNLKAKASKGKAGAPKRVPLHEQANDQQGSDAEDDFDDLAENSRAATFNAAQDSEPEALPKKQAVRRGRPPGKAKQAPAEKTTAAEVETTQRDGEFKFAPTRPQPEKAASKAKKGSRPQDDRTDNEYAREIEKRVRDTLYSSGEDEVTGTFGFQKSKPARKAPVQSSSTQPSSSRRVESFVQPEQGGDPALRRKLGEMTRKFEALESRYKKLKQVGIFEAEANCINLRKESEKSTRGNTARAHSLYDANTLQMQTP